MLQARKMQKRELSPEYRRALAVSFPEYRGRRFREHVRPSDKPMSVVSCWDGGTRSDFVCVRLADGKAIPIPENGSGYGGRYSIAAPASTVIPSGCVIVEHCIFQGKDLGITFHVSADMLEGTFSTRIGG